MTGHDGENLWLDTVVEFLGDRLGLKRPGEIGVWLDMGAPAIAGSRFIAVMPQPIRFDDTDLCLIEEVAMSVAIIVRAPVYPRDRRGKNLLNTELTPLCRRVVREIHMNYELMELVNNKIREHIPEDQEPGYWHPMKALDISEPRIVQGASFEVSREDEGGVARICRFGGARR